MSGSIILYAAHERLTDNHQPIETAAGTIYIRTYFRKGDSVGVALDKADPMKEEIVLNSIPTKEDWK